MDERIIEIVKSVNELLLNLCTRIDDICNKYKLYNELDDLRIINLIDDLNTLTEGIDVVKDCYSSIDLFEFTDKLGMLYSAFENKNYLLFTDVLEYELKPLLEYWIECFK